MENDPIISRNANILTSMRNADLGRMRVKQKSTITLAVALVGNWVGGKFKLFDDNILFEINALNAHFQSDTSPTMIPLADITHLSQGKMLLFAPTLDVQCSDILFRFRMFKIPAALQKLEAMCTHLK